MDTFQRYQTGNLCVQWILWEPGEEISRGHQSFISMKMQEDHWGFHPPNTRIRTFIYYLKRFSKKSTGNKNNTPTNSVISPVISYLLTFRKKVNKTQLQKKKCLQKVMAHVCIIVLQ